MTKLSDTQSIILSAAAQRADGNVLPLPGSLRGGAATKVVAALLSRGLIREHIIDSPRKADAAINTVWRNLDEGRGVLLFITTAGADAIGIEPESVPDAAEAAVNPVNDPAFGEHPKAMANTASWDHLPDHGTPSGAAKKRRRSAVKAPTDSGEASDEWGAKRRGRPRKAAPKAPDTAAPRKTRDGTKQAQLIAMLRRKEGATIAQIVEATGWQPHTVRGAFAGALKKKLGLTVTSEKVEGIRVYRVVG